MYVSVPCTCLAFEVKRGHHIPYAWSNMVLSCYVSARILSSELATRASLTAELVPEYVYLMPMFMILRVHSLLSSEKCKSKCVLSIISSITLQGFFFFLMGISLILFFIQALYLIHKNFPSLYFCQLITYFCSSTLFLTHHAVDVQLKR